MNKKYKINEVARIFGISRQTLIYYDRINLFQPEYIDEENSYRYYVQEQFFQLRFILILKEAGFSLSEIKEYTRSETPEESLDYLEEKYGILEEKIKLLQESKKIIGKKIDEIKNIRKVGKGKPKFVNMESRRVYNMKLESPLSFVDFDTTFYKLEDMKKELLIEGDEYIEELSRESIESLEYMGLKTLGFYIPENFPGIEGEGRIPQGTYATIFHGDIWLKIGESYEKLMKFIDENNYRIAGDALEVFSKIGVHLGKGEGTTVNIFIPVKKIIK